MSGGTIRREVTYWGGLSARTAGSGSEAVTVTRYYGPEGPEEAWRAVSEAAGWAAYGPAGRAFAPQPSLAEALDISGACRFEEGVALHISKTDPLPLLPVLRGWAEAPSGSGPEVSWKEHPVMGWAYDEVSPYAGAEGLSFDLSRLVRVGSSTIAVGRHPRIAPSRFLVVIDELGGCGMSPPVVFTETWAAVTANNGYGPGHYEIGEIAPGVVGDFRADDEFPSLDIWPRFQGVNERLYEQMVKWAHEKVEFSFYGQAYTLDFSGGSITASFEEHEEQDLVSGFFGPTVMRSVQADAAGGAE